MPSSPGAVWHRDAEPADAPLLAAFWRDRFVETFGLLYPPADLEAFLDEAYAPAQVLRELEDPGLVHRLAFQGGALMGAVKGGAVSLPIADPVRLWELHRLYLCETAKGTGLADALMAWARAQAQAAGAEAMVLGVFHANHRAQRFYARHGFEKVGAYHFVVGQTLDDEWIMRAAL